MTFRNTEDRFSNETITLPLAYIMDNCRDWVEFCEDLGLDSWMFAEGKADDSTAQTITIAQARKYGLLA